MTFITTIAVDSENPVEIISNMEPFEMTNTQSGKISKPDCGLARFLYISALRKSAPLEMIVVNLAGMSHVTTSRWTDSNDIANANEAIARMIEK